MRKSTPLHPMTIRPLGAADGDVLGQATPYRLRARLHAGRLATVHVAQARLAGQLVREVALKFPHGPSALPRAIAEARVYSRVHGPAFGAFLGFVMADANAEAPRPMLIFERWQGVSLAALMKEGEAPLEIDAASFVALCIFEALAALHEAVEPDSLRPAPIAHGAVVAENIFLTWDGHVKLHGLGGSRVLAGPGDASAAIRADVVAAQQLVQGILEGRERLRRANDRFRDCIDAVEDKTPDAGVLARAGAAAALPIGPIATRWSAREMAAAFDGERLGRTGREALARALARNFDAPTVPASGVLRRAPRALAEAEEAALLGASADDTLVVPADQIESLVRDTQPTLPPPPAMVASVVPGHEGIATWEAFPPPPPPPVAVPAAAIGKAARAEPPPRRDPLRTHPKVVLAEEPAYATPPPFIAATPPSHFAPAGGGPLAEASSPIVLRRRVRWVLASAAAVWAVALLMGASRLRARPAPSATALDVRCQGPDGALAAASHDPRTRASERPASAPGSGILRMPPSAAGHRIYVDGRLLGDGAAILTVPCGPRKVRIGRQGSERVVNVPCGGDIDVGR